MNQLLLLAWLLPSAWLVAQPSPDNHLDGYILPSEGDTLFGVITFINPVHNQVSVTFRAYDADRSRQYEPQDLIGYAFWNVGNRGNDAKVIYQRKRVPIDPVEDLDRPRTLFLQVIDQGDINLYHFYTLDIQRINQREYIRSYFVEDLAPNGGIPLTHITRENFARVTAEVLARNDYLAQHLGKPGFGFKYLPEMIHFHNNLNAPHAHWLIADQ